VSRAKATTYWRAPDDVVVDHARLAAADRAWLLPAKAITLWAVTVTDGLLASLPNLVFLDLRGGSGASIACAAGCARLRYLEVNQVRGLHDLSVVPTLTNLELVSLYGLPKVVELPSMAPLRRLRRAELGSMKGLAGLTGLLDAPALEELRFYRAVRTAPGDAERLATHPTLREFEWSAEDAVPLAQWQTFVRTVGKPPARALLAREWFAGRGGL